MAPKHQLSYSSPDTELPQSKRRSKLSAEQLQRKRASDREAQRALREKTKNHVAHLESLVQSLQGEQEGRVERLITQLDEQRAETARLRTALMSIAKLADAARQPIQQAVPESAPASHGGLQARDDSPVGNLQPEESEQESIQSDTGAFEVIPRVILEPTELLSTPKTFAEISGGVEACAFGQSLSFDEAVATDGTSNPEQSAQSLSIAQMASGIVRKKDLDGRFWFLAGTLLSYILKNQDGHPVHTAYDEDIAIRAVFEGWSAVIERYPLDRGWQWLKELDENIYFQRSAQHRLMHLRNSRLQLLHQLDPLGGWDRALPTCFAPRPSQLHIEHDPLLEHFPWPGFRERILFSPRKFATNHFMEALRKNVHFLWPYDTHDLYVKNAGTGLYSYSNALKRQMMDIRCYTADSDFFANFPELRQDIPLNENSPSMLSTSLTIRSESPTPSEEDRTRRSVAKALIA